MTTGSTDPRRVAERLGLDEAVVQRLEARGHLARLGLTEYEMRRRIYHAHCQHIQSTKGEIMTSRTRRAWISIAMVAALAAAIGAQGASAKTEPRHPTTKQSSAYVQDYSPGTIPQPGHVYIN